MSASTRYIDRHAGLQAALSSLSGAHFESLKHASMHVQIGNKTIRIPDEMVAMVEAQYPQWLGTANEKLLRALQTVASGRRVTLDETVKDIEEPVVAGLFVRNFTGLNGQPTHVAARDLRTLQAETLKRIFPDATINEAGVIMLTPQARAIIRQTLKLKTKKPAREVAVDRPTPQPITTSAAKPTIH